MARTYNIHDPTAWTGCNYRDDFLTTEQMNQIHLDVAAGVPSQLKTKEAVEFRKSCEKAHAKAKAQGKTIDMIAEHQEL